MKREGKIIALDRRQLIEYYLSSKNRIPWKLDRDNVSSVQIGKRGEWASLLIVLATILNGLPTEEISNILPDGFDKSYSNLEKLIRYCEWVLSKPSFEKLEKFEPSIFGETFFLLFIREFGNDTDLMKSFNKHLSSHCSEPVGETIMPSFFSGLSANLLLDDDPKFERSAWRALMKVTSSRMFPSGKASKRVRNSIRIQVFTSVYLAGTEKSRKVINDYFDLDDLVPLDGGADGLGWLFGSSTYFLIHSDIKKYPNEFSKISRRQKLKSVLGMSAIYLFILIAALFFSWSFCYLYLTQC